MKAVYHKALMYNDGDFSEVKDALAVEESLNIFINGSTFTVTMRTPGHDDELIAGLLYSEEVYRDKPALIKLIEQNKSAAGLVNEINVELPKDQILKDFEGSRNLISASSCGLCGRTSFDETVSDKKVKTYLRLNPALIEKMFDQMSNHQENFKTTGGTHAAGAFTINGSLLCVREDIGRHNAVDKVIGALLLTNKLNEAHCMLVSGRLSYEIVNKARSAGIQFLASVSAPSSMAVNDAQNAGITLLAFCRKNKLTVYSHPENVIQSTGVPLTIVK